MRWIRSVLYVAVMTITVIPYAIFLSAFIVAPVRVRYRVAVGWIAFAVWAGRILCGIRHEVRGFDVLEQLSRDNVPVILAPKHQSTWETFFLPTLAPRELCYVYKRELHWLPFFGWGLAQLRMIHIDRSRGIESFEQVVEQGTQRLAEGRWIIMFPEGTRTPVGARSKYKTGAARLAVRTGARVVPIAINSGECWPKRPFVKTPGTIVVSIGPSIAVDGKTPDRVNAEVQDWIETEMRRISPQVYAPETHAPAAPRVADRSRP